MRHSKVRVVICYLISWWMSSSEKSPDCCHHTFTDRDPFESISAPCWQDTRTSQTHHTLHRLQFMYLNIAVSCICSIIIDFSPHLVYLQAADVILNALKYVLRLKGIQRKKGALNLKCEILCWSSSTKSSWFVVTRKLGTNWNIWKQFSLNIQ